MACIINQGIGNTGISYRRLTATICFSFAFRVNSRVKKLIQLICLPFKIDIDRNGVCSFRHNRQHHCKYHRYGNDKSQDF